MSSESLNSPRFSLLDHLLGGTALSAPSLITGPFGLLPAELLEVVAYQLLRVDAGAQQRLVSGVEIADAVVDDSDRRGGDGHAIRACPWSRAPLGRR